EERAQVVETRGKEQEHALARGAELLEERRDRPGAPGERLVLELEPHAVVGLEGVRRPRGLVRRPHFQEVDERDGSGVRHAMAARESRRRDAPADSRWPLVPHAGWGVK